MLKDKLQKPKLSLLPYYALAKVAKVADFGNQKYKDIVNWQQVPTSVFIDASLRHIYRHVNGTYEDKESTQPHLAHAICNLLYALANIEANKEINK